MKKLVWEDDVDEVDVGDGDFISIASTLSIKDVSMVSAAENPQEAAMSMLRRLVRSWRGPSFERDGEPVPCTPENIERLEMSVATVISTAISEKLSRDSLDDEAKKESTETSLSTLTTPGTP